MIFTSSSSRFSFSSSNGFSSKLRSKLFCACINLGRVNDLRIFQLKVSGILNESFLRGLDVVSKPRGLPGPGLDGIGHSVEAIADLGEFFSIAQYFLTCLLPRYYAQRKIHSSGCCHPSRDLYIFFF